MRHKRFFVSLTFFILFLSCSLFKKKANLDIREYFPLEVGNWWEYSAAVYWIEDGETTYVEPFLAKFVIEGKKNIYNKEFFAIFLYENGRKVDNLPLYIRAEEQFLLIIYPPRRFNEPEQKYFEDTTGYYLVDTLFHHPNFEKGEIWRLYFDDFNWVAKGEGEERIGPYDCVKVRYTALHEWEVEFYLFGLFGEVGACGNKYLFCYGKDVGIVKAESLLENEEGLLEGICSFHLTNYHIKKNKK